MLEVPRRIVYPNGLHEDVLGKHVNFRGGMFETEDTELIEKLQKHRLFNAAPGVPGAFWIYTPPRDIEAELAAAKEEAAKKDKELEELKASLEKIAKEKEAEEEAAEAKKNAKTANVKEKAEMQVPPPTPKT